MSLVFRLFQQLLVIQPVRRDGNCADRFLAQPCRELLPHCGRTLIGGSDDIALGREIEQHCSAVNSIGRFSLLASAELIRQCRLILCNDSAPLHLAVAVGTPVVALFGPTVPGFGFSPWGEGHTLLQQELSCRPCSDHGGNRCPMRHFHCMKFIETKEVIQAVEQYINDT